MPAILTRSLLALTVLVVALGPAGCKDKDKEPPSPLEELEDELLKVQVVGTPLVLRVPRGWEVHDIDLRKATERPRSSGPADAGPGEPPAVKLTGRTLFKAIARKDKPAEAAVWVPPRIEIYHDPWLPVGTSAQDYLDAQRKENEKAVKQPEEGAVSRIRHVEAERSRRQGRPSYHVRDEWVYKLGGQREVVSQESLLLVDKQGEDLHGYTIVITMMEGDLEELERLRRAVIESVQFAKE